MNRKDGKPIYWSLLAREGWSLHMAATPEGLCFVGSQNKPFDELRDWAARRFPGGSLVRDDGRLEPYATELAEYLQGKRQSFTVPFDCGGTAFQLAVWNALRCIPYGEVRTYSDIAEQIDKPSAARAVGAAIGANPVLITVPCHRVVGKDGTMTGYRGGLPMKKRLLQLERESV
ncbi:methylated-DNA--[protein]-cysteine S-methyltransferase [Paenibacillus arenilitoris]|uniref:Methylated-DNA--protein-cysteine methyltransferase n=1 Tax=Paenibacillus arenilitoris TaxID=2772299 RepID=A0A927CJM4_9BACL|nr:methylated-DNA--[protein]-cysteine S-methyltransferase [Paenibacillus arenilitoris]MBD2868680.1 methylated-DNA--[protein]-cysteine S-methyltransferase [Paenibacillus arenilitoris]